MYAILIITLFVPLYAKKKSDIKVFSCYSVEAKAGESKTAIELTFEDNAHDIIVTQFLCTDPFASALGKRGDLIIFPESSLPHEVNNNFFAPNSPVQKTYNINPLFSQTAGKGILMQFVPTQGELAGATIEVIIKQTPLPKKIKAEYAQLPEYNADTTFLTYYRRIQMPRRPQAEWTEFSYNEIPSDAIPKNFTISMLPDGDITIAFPETKPFTLKTGTYALTPNSQKEKK